MEKFLNIMYDFFAFALPGACIIVSVLLLNTDDKFLYESVLEHFSGTFWHLFLALTILGYIVGYIIKPIARYILLQKLSIFLYASRLISEDLPSKSKKEKLTKALENKNRADDFIKIKELTPNSFKYIEFWDMHTSMAHNLAFASLVFLFFQTINFFSNKPLSNYWHFIILVILSLTAFFILLRIAIKFAYWWYSDIDAALQYIEARDLMKKDN